MHIYVETPTGDTITLEAVPDDTIKTLKALIANVAKIHRRAQDLVYGDATLEDDRTLADYNIQNACTVVMRKVYFGAGKRARQVVLVCVVSFSTQC